MNFLWVFLGGGIGSVLRYLIGILIRQWELNFPWGTFAANMISCLLLGLLTGLFIKDQLSFSARLFFMTGLCGGFSTFSTFSFEIVDILKDGNWTATLLYVGSSLVFGVIAIFIGLKTTQWIF